MSLKFCQPTRQLGGQPGLSLSVSALSSLVNGLAVAVLSLAALADLTARVALTATGATHGHVNDHWRSPSQIQIFVAGHSQTRWIWMLRSKPASGSVCHAHRSKCPSRDNVALAVQATPSPRHGHWAFKCQTVVG